MNKENCITRFGLRAYALIVNQNQEILLSDEFYKNLYFTKFPGGGVEFGEGILDCLHREAMEELGQDIEVTGHFYTTGFFQQGLFYPDMQLVSVYYKAQLPESPRFRISLCPFDFDVKTGQTQSFRWKALSEFSMNDVTLPIDKVVAKMLTRGALQPE